MRIQKEKLCVVCEKPFIPKSGSGLYCSVECRKEANRKKKLEKNGKNIFPSQKYSESEESII